MRGSEGAQGTFPQLFKNGKSGRNLVLSVPVDSTGNPPKWVPRAGWVANPTVNRPWSQSSVKEEKEKNTKYLYIQSIYRYVQQLSNMIVLEIRRNFSPSPSPVTISAGGLSLFLVLGPLAFLLQFVLSRGTWSFCAWTWTTSLNNSSNPNSSSPRRGPWPPSLCSSMESCD